MSLKMKVTIWNIFLLIDLKKYKIQFCVFYRISDICEIQLIEKNSYLISARRFWQCQSSILLYLEHQIRGGYVPVISYKMINVGFSMKFFCIDLFFRQFLFQKIQIDPWFIDSFFHFYFISTQLDIGMAKTLIIISFWIFLYLLYNYEGHESYLSFCMSWRIKISKQCYVTKCKHHF